MGAPRVALLQTSQFADGVLTSPTVLASLGAILPCTSANNRACSTASVPLPLAMQCPQLPVPHTRPNNSTPSPGRPACLQT